MAAISKEERESTPLGGVQPRPSRWVPGPEFRSYGTQLRNCGPGSHGVLAGKGRASEIVKMRELIGMVGVERFGVKVTELADVFGKSRDGVSCWMRRGVERRTTDPSFAAAAERLEYFASEEP